MVHGQNRYVAAGDSQMPYGIPVGVNQIKHHFAKCTDKHTIAAHFASCRRSCLFLLQAAVQLSTSQLEQKE